MRKTTLSSLLLLAFLPVILVFGSSAWGQSAESLVITEFLASNDATLADGDGDYADWVEIHNPTGASVSLADCYLSDDVEEPTKWRFPDGAASAVPANGYLVVFASDKSTDAATYMDPLGYLHTSFKLSADGEDVVLTAADGATTISAFADFPLQGTDVSYGLGANAVTGFMQTPTPGAANADASSAGWVEDTKFSVNRGFYSAAFTVEISTATEDATIKYTLDGSTPSETNGAVYAAPIPVAGTTTLRAMAYKTDWVSTNVDTQTYIFLDDIVSQPATKPGDDWPDPSSGSTGGRPGPPGPGGGDQAYDYEMDPDVTGDARYADLIDDALLSLPSVSIVTDLPNLFADADGIYENPRADLECLASIEYLLPDGADGFQVNAGLKIRGGSSTNTNNPKHSFRIIMRSDYGDSKIDYPLLGEDGPDKFDKMDFRTAQNYSWNNSSPETANWLDDPFSRDTMRDMGNVQTEGDFFHLYLNGVYWGLYQFEERPDAYFAQSHLGGSSEDYDAIKADSGNGEMYTTDGTLDAYNAYWSLVNAGVASNADFMRLLGKNDDGTDNPSYPRYLDVENLADYMLIVFFTGARDMPLGPPNIYTQPRNLNIVYNNASPDGFRYIVHDNEWSLLERYGVDTNLVDWTLSPGLSEQQNFNPWWLHLELMDNAEYRLQFADRVQEHFFNGGALTPEACVARYQKRMDEIDLAIIAESARWGDTLSADAPRTKDDDWLPSVQWARDSFLNASPQTRTEIVLDQLRSAGLYPTVAAPAYSHQSGEYAEGLTLQITAEQGTIYYTTDGGDPREVGGAVSGAAQSGVSGLELPISGSTTVMARAYDSGTWSALAAVDLVVPGQGPGATLWRLF